MKRNRRVLVATHFGRGADDALREGARLARESGATLGIMHVTPMLTNERTTLSRRKALRRLERLVRLQLTRAAGSLAERIEIYIDQGEPHAQIIERATTWGADVVIVGATTHPLLRRILPGVGERLVREARCSVLVARTTSGEGGVLAATDLTKPRLPAVVAGAEEADWRGSHLKVVHAISFWSAEARYLLRGLPHKEASSSDYSTFFSQLEHAVAEMGRGDPCEILHGSPAHAIICDAERSHADLIVLATTERRGTTRPVRSKAIALEVVSNAPCSVLVVPALAEAS